MVALVILPPTLTSFFREHFLNTSVPHELSSKSLLLEPWCSFYISFESMSFCARKLDKLGWISLFFTGNYSPPPPPGAGCPLPLGLSFLSYKSRTKKRHFTLRAAVMINSKNATLSTETGKSHTHSCYCAKFRKEFIKCCKALVLYLQWCSVSPEFGRGQEGDEEGEK